MFTDTSWVVTRHPHAFTPRTWQMVLCRRNTTVEVLPGVQERRYGFAIDVYSGQSWAREGSGAYEYWTDFPPIEKWCPAKMTPPMDAECVFWLANGYYAGMQIGQVVLDSSQHVVWQVRDPYSTHWVNVLSSHVGHWLLLPPH
jgi:hypothetical protein